MIRANITNCSVSGMTTPILAPANVPTAPNRPKTRTMRGLTFPRHPCCRAAIPAVRPTTPKLMAIAGFGSAPRR